MKVNLTFSASHNGEIVFMMSRIGECPGELEWVTQAERAAFAAEFWLKVSDQLKYQQQELRRRIEGK